MRKYSPNSMIDILTISFMVLFIVQYIKSNHQIKEMKTVNLIFIINKNREFSAISVSVIVSVYNKRLYLIRSLNCLYKQTYQNFEIIYVDDNSSDKSTEFIINKTRNDKRIKLIQHIYNQGTCNSRIHGVLFSKGQYIMTLDPDDLLYLNAIELSYKRAIETNADVLEMMMETRKGKLWSKRWHPCKKNYTDTETIFKDLLKFKFKITPWNLARKTIKRSLYRKAVDLLTPFVRDKRIYFAEDLLHSAAIFLFSKNWICSDFLGYIYFMDLPNASLSGSPEKIMQNNVQYNYTKCLVRYFYYHRNDLNNCSLNNFLSFKKNLDLYSNVTNISRMDYTKRDNELKGLNYVLFENDGYYYIHN